MMIRSTPEVNIPILKTLVLSLLAESFDIKGAISAPEIAITTSASDDLVALKSFIRIGMMCVIEADKPND